MAFEDIPTRSNGQKILAEWFNALRAQGQTTAGWTKYTVTHDDLSAAALTQDVTLLELAIKGLIEGVIIKSKTAFSGGSVSSLLFDLGISGDESRWVTDYDGMAAVSNTNFEAITVLDVLSFTAETDIVLKATAVGANLSALTAGELEIWIKKATLG